MKEGKLVFVVRDEDTVVDSAMVISVSSTSLSSTSENTVKVLFNWLALFCLMTSLFILNENSLESSVFLLPALSVIFPSSMDNEMLAFFE